MKIKSLNIYKFLFFLSLFLFELSSYAQSAPVVRTYNLYIFYIALFVSIVNLIFTLCNMKINFKRLVILLFLITCSLLIYFKTNDYLFVQLVLVLINSINITFDEIIEKDLKIKIVILIFILSCYFLGLTAQDQFYRNGSIRYTFGFNHPNTFAFFILMLILEYIYIKRERIKKSSVLLISIPAFILFEMADSRSSMVALLLFDIMYLFKNKSHNKIKSRKIFTIICSMLFLILLIISIMITKGYINGNNYMIKLNTLLSSRLYIQGLYMQSYSISLFGNKVDYLLTLDNVYIRTIINFGIIGVLVFFYIYNRMITFSKKQNDYVMYIILIILLVYGLMEWYVIRPVLNIFLFYYSSYLFSKVGGKNERNNIYNNTNI